MNNITTELKKSKEIAKKELSEDKAISQVLLLTNGDRLRRYWVRRQ